MSSLQKSFAKAKLAGFPLHPPLPPGAGSEVLAEESHAEAEEDGLGPLPEHLNATEIVSDDSSSSASSASSANSVGTIRPEPQRRLFARPRGTGTESSRSNYSPLPWTAYFDQELRLSDPKSPFVYHAYVSPPTSASAPLFVMHHGAGSSALSFAACAAEMRRLAPEIGVLSIDARGHGETVIVPPAAAGNGNADASGAMDSYTEQRLARKQGEDKDGVLDLSLETLAADLEKVLKLVAEKLSWSELPNVILVGHSLGGAVVTHVAKGGRLGNKVLGYVVLDVVEGSAIDALQSMQTYLSNRPKTFPSVEAAIEWHLRSRTIRTSQSARISVPPLLREAKPSSTSPPHSPNPFNIVTTFPITHPNTFSTTPISSPVAGPSQSGTSTPTSPTARAQTSPTSATATSESPKATSDTSTAPPPPANLPRYTWRTDLRSTSPFWENWFVGLSNKFLTARGGKLLLLAGTDRLDKELMIGQMQGKYQLQVYPDAGHFIQEDLPEKTAVALVDFWRRNDGKLILPPKVGVLKKKPPPGLGAG